MKRYLITITGRANLGYKGNRLRERDLCCAYVYGKNKAEAISKFWEQIEKSSGLKGFERRDFKITAERWEKEADLDVNGNPLKDLEWAIPFDLLSSVELMHDEHFKNYKLAVPESIMAQAEADQAKAERIHDQILETALEKALESNSEAQAEAIQNGKIINPEKKYHVISWRIGAPIEEKTDCGIWDGSGMAHFSEGFGGFAYSSDGWLYFAQEAEEESSADQLASLKAKRKQLAKKQHHILERYGNNQESQSIFKEITEIDSQIKKIEFKIGAVVRIVDLDSANYGEWGIIEKFDGYFYYLAMHGDHEHAPMIIKEKQIELASGKEAE